MIVPGCLNGFSDEEIDLMTRISLLSGRPVNWNVLAPSAGNPDGNPTSSALTAVAGAAGRLVALTLPHTMALRLSFEHGAILDGLPGRRVLRHHGRPADGSPVRPGGPAGHGRARPVRRGRCLRFLANWDRLVVAETFSPQNAGLEGKPVSVVAGGAGAERVGRPLRDRGGRPTAHRVLGPDPGDRRRLGGRGRRSGETQGGGRRLGRRRPSRPMCGAVYSTTLLGEGVRERQLLPIEEAAT